MPPISKAERAEREARLAQGLWKCSSCEGTKPVKEFGKNAARSWSGLASLCKPCNSAYNATHYAVNRDSILEQRRDYYANNRDSINERRREYNAVNRDSILEQRRDYYANNQDNILEQQREYRAQRMTADPLWNRLNQGAVRARKLGVPLEQFTSADLLAYWASRGIDPSRCYYTGEGLGPDYHLDHMTPLCRGGAHAPDNVVPCSPAANTSKGQRTAAEFAADLVVTA